jgi:hypothetical protein
MTVVTSYPARRIRFMPAIAIVMTVRFTSMRQDGNKAVVLYQISRIGRVIVERRARKERKTYAVEYLRQWRKKGVKLLCEIRSFRIQKVLENLHDFWLASQTTHIK